MMTNHLKGLLIAFFGVLVLTPEGILVKLANSDSFTVLFWRGIFFALSILIILFIGYRSRAIKEIKNIGKDTAPKITIKSTMFGIAISGRFANL